MPGEAEAEGFATAALGRLDGEGEGEALCEREAVNEGESEDVVEGTVVGEVEAPLDRDTGEGESAWELVRDDKAPSAREAVAVIEIVEDVKGEGEGEAPRESEGDAIAIPDAGGEALNDGVTPREGVIVPDKLGVVGEALTD